MAGPWGVLATVAVAAVLTGCVDQIDDPGTEPESTVTAEDPRGDVLVSGSGRPSDRTANVDLTGLSVTYDDEGLRFEVSYAEPIDPPGRPGAAAYELQVNFDHDPRDDGLDDKALAWSSDRPGRVVSWDSTDIELGCRPGVRTDPTAGRLTITYPVGSGCLDEAPPARARVLHVSSFAGGVEDDVLADGDEPAPALWVERG